MLADLADYTLHSVVAPSVSLVRISVCLRIVIVVYIPYIVTALL